MALRQFETPSDVLGIIFVFIAVILFFVLGIYLLFSYNKTKSDSTLFLSLILLFGFGALISLTVEQVILIVSGVTPADAPMWKSILQYTGEELGPFWLAYIFACSAYLTSALAVLSAVFFTKSFFPQRTNRILIIPAIMLLLYVVILLYSPFQWNLVGGDWQPEHGTNLDVILWLLMFPPLWSVTILFVYLTQNLYRRGVSQWKQVFLTTIGAILLSTGYTIEIINVPDPILSLLSRFVIMMYPIFAYFGFTPPNWFRRRLE